MFGGSTLTFIQHGPTIGQPLRRTSYISRVDDKPNATTPLKVCTLRHEYVCDTTNAPVLTEEQAIIYIAPSPSDAPRAKTTPATKSRPESGPPVLGTVIPTPTMLFRYSALTFNSHRIHYDLECVTVALAPLFMSLCVYSCLCFPWSHRAHQSSLWALPVMICS